MESELTDGSKLLRQYDGIAVNMIGFRLMSFRLILAAYPVAARSFIDSISE